MAILPANETSSDRPYVVVGALAFDETSESVLNEAARLSAAADRELHLTHVIHEGPHATSKGELRSLENHLNEANSELHRLLTKQSARKRVICHVRVGDVARSIVQLAVDLSADMLVIGTHKRNPVAELLLGSITKEVISHAHCPVLIAIPKNYAGATASETITPPCPDCLTARRQSQNERFWCARHQHSYHKPHVYVPSETGRPMSVIPGGH
jgi:nucleotide-binding universal stress UspA family protein